MFKVNIRNQIRTLSGEGNNSKYKLGRNRFHENEQGCVKCQVKYGKMEFSELDDVEMIDGFPIFITINTILPIT